MAARWHQFYRAIQAHHLGGLNALQVSQGDHSIDDPAHSRAVGGGVFTGIPTPTAGDMEAKAEEKEEEPGVTSYSGAFEQGGAKGKGERAFRPAHASAACAYHHDALCERI